MSSCANKPEQVQISVRKKRGKNTKCVCVGTWGVDISDLGCSNFRSMALGGKGESLWGVK